VGPRATNLKVVGNISTISCDVVGRWNSGASTSQTPSQDCQTSLVVIG